MKNKLPSCLYKLQRTICRKNSQFWNFHYYSIMHLGMFLNTWIPATPGKALFLSSQNSWSFSGIVAGTVSGRGADGEVTGMAFFNSFTLQYVSMRWISQNTQNQTSIFWTGNFGQYDKRTGTIISEVFYVKNCCERNLQLENMPDLYWQDGQWWRLSNDKMRKQKNEQISGKMHTIRWVLKWWLFWRGGLNRSSPVCTFTQNSEGLHANFPCWPSYSFLE